MPLCVSADTESVVRSCYAAWANRDIDATLAVMAEDCVFDLHVPTDVLPFGGAHRGKAAIADCLGAILIDYSFIAYAVDWLVVEGDLARAQIVYYYQHIDSAQSIDGRFRHVWHVTDGLVQRIDEYHDVERLRAFLHMVQSLRTP